MKKNTLTVVMAVLAMAALVGSSFAVGNPPFVTGELLLNSAPEYVSLNVDDLDSIHVTSSIAQYVLPDYNGYYAGGIVVDAVGNIYAAKQDRLTIYDSQFHVLGHAAVNPNPGLYNVAIRNAQQAFSCNPTTPYARLFVFDISDVHNPSLLHITADIPASPNGQCRGITFDAHGHLWVASFGQLTKLTFNTAGDIVGSSVFSLGGYNPYDTAFHPGTGLLLYSGINNNNVVIANPNDPSQTLATITNVCDTADNSPLALAFDSTGNLFVSCNGNADIIAYRSHTLIGLSGTVDSSNLNPIRWDGGPNVHGGILAFKPAANILTNTPTPTPTPEIVFDSNRDANNELYVMRADGTGQTRLTNSPSSELYAAWSPDGTRIAFTDNVGGVLSSNEIYVINVDGTGRVRLTNNAVEDSLPAWSPDSTMIAFNSVRDSAFGEIYVMNADGTNVRRLTTNSATDARPNWSPDGTKIAFQRHVTNYDIYVMNAADGSGQTQLTNTTAGEADPAWSSDGTRIAFDSDRDGNLEIYVMNADGTGQSRRTFNTTSDIHPKWSPNSGRIVFQSLRDGNHEIYVMNADGTGQTNISNNPAIDARPDWRPMPSSTPTPIDTHTSTSTHTPTSTATPTYTPTETSTPTNTPTHTFTSTSTPTDTPTNTSTSTPTLTNTPTSTPTNAPPVVGTITATRDPIQIGTTITATARFTDADVFDTHTSVWNWGDGSSSSGLISESGGSGTVTGTHVYTDPGIYTIQVTVTDNHGASGTSTFMYVVVYDPDGGFVTGGGWFTSPAGAYRPNQALTGRVNLGFVAKYKWNRPSPEGETEFNFSQANFNFHSEQYQWLVVSGAKAQYQGTGTVNGSGSYSFLVTIIDGGLAGNHAPDRFRIKVWDTNNYTVIYDNQYGAPDNADPTTELGGGSIHIHNR